MHTNLLLSLLSPLLLLPHLTTAYKGSLTHYTPGLGSCGMPSLPTDNIVALSTGMMQNAANPNANSVCWMHITIGHHGRYFDATVVDTCEGCDYEDLDVSSSLFEKVAPEGDGRVEGVEWWFDAGDGGRPQFGN
ncbi:hypothetical protein MMC12_006908 [Toensbergia leucococca]|nr:hypothetical protein [Toensbergia leucococca]